MDLEEKRPDMYPAIEISVRNIVEDNRLEMIIHKAKWVFQSFYHKVNNIFYTKIKLGIYVLLTINRRIVM